MRETISALAEIAKVNLCADNLESLAKRLGALQTPSCKILTACSPT